MQSTSLVGETQLRALNRRNINQKGREQTTAHVDDLSVIQAPGRRISTVMAVTQCQLWPRIIPRWESTPMRKVVGWKAELQRWITRAQASEMARGLDRTLTRPDLQPVHARTRARWGRSIVEVRERKKKYISRCSLGLSLA